MNSWKNLFLFHKKTEYKKRINQSEFDKYKEIAKLVKEARIRDKSLIVIFRWILASLTNLAISLYLSNSL